MSEHKREETAFEQWCDNACNAMVKPTGFLTLLAIAITVVAAGVAVPVKLLSWAFGG